MWFVIHLRVPGTLRYRDLAVRVVGTACKLVGTDGGDSSAQHVDKDFDHQVVSAFGEAFNNVAIHSYRGGAPGDVEVEVDAGPSHITIRMRDWGRSFALDDVPVPDLDAMPESGLGLFIIRSFMDEVQYRPGTPNVLSMTKQMDPTSRPTRKPADSFDDNAGGKSRQ
jgi:serine/threonine-protein kinase RsbW